MVSDTNDGRIPPELLKKRLLALLETRKGEFAPSNPEIDKYEHSLQCATRAHRAGEPPDYVVMALFHDVFGGFSATEHGLMLLSSLGPYIGDRSYAALENHESQMELVRAGVETPEMSSMIISFTFARDYDFPSFDPHYSTLSLRYLKRTINEVIK